MIRSAGRARDELSRTDPLLIKMLGVSLIGHAVFWVIWHFFVAPYPIALTIPVPFPLGPFSGLTDYIWPLANTSLLVLNVVLAFRVYKKDIFASWLLIGASIFIQILLMAVTLYLISFVTAL